MTIRNRAIPLVIVITGIALLALAIWAVLSLPRLAPGGAGNPVLLWGRLVTFDREKNILTVTVERAPTGGASATAPAAPAALTGQQVTVQVPPGTSMTADYYAGDIIGGQIVLSEPIRWPKVQPGILLTLTVRPTGNPNTWIAESISWRQTTTQTPLPPPDTKIPPRITPP